MARATEMSGALTAGEFDHAVRRYSRLSDKAIAASRALLVDGDLLEHVAQSHGSSRQMVHKWATKVFESFRPEGWLTETVTLPAAQMAVVREMEQQARLAWSNELPEPRIVRRQA